ncbi:hypothetical protein LTR37_017706 [Vermiconidia calcicola]|uniref:Uncharacterized protein n=1 Tax=Vermiconidia calcicola TaxID=1690605 RepID=A0ACC3MJZ5_9PEZI|nr:hypothetical protein LTR37_017706 [Vermiconidia calcicola]
MSEGPAKPQSPQPPQQKLSGAEQESPGIVMAPGPGTSRPQAKGKGRAASSGFTANPQKAAAALNASHMQSSIAAPVGMSDTVTPVEIEQQPHLKNWKCWSAIKDGLQLNRLVEGKVTPLIPARLQGLLAQAPLKDCDWQLLECGHIVNSKLPSNKNTFPNLETVKSGYWRFLLKNYAVKAQIDTTRRCAWIPDDILPADDEERAKTVATELCNLLNRLPIARLTLVTTDPTAQLLMMSAIMHTSNMRGEVADLISRDVLAIRKFTAFELKWEKKQNGYLATMLTYDNKLQAQYAATRVLVKPSEVSTARQIPALPSQLAQLLPEISHPPKLDSDDDKAAHARAVSLCRFLQYVMYGACGHEQALVSQANYIASRYKVSKEASAVGDVHEGQALLSLTKEADYVSIKLTQQALNDIEGGGEVPEIQIIGHSKARVAIIVEEIISSYLEGRNILDSWQSGVLKADNVNRTPADQPFSHRCSHSEAERPRCFHICQGGCNGITWCDELRLMPSVNLRVWPQCEVRCGTTEVSEYETAHGGPQARSLLGKATLYGLPSASNTEQKTTKETSSEPPTKKVKVHAPGYLVRNKALVRLHEDVGGEPRHTLAARQGAVGRFTARFFDQETGERNDAYANVQRPDEVTKASGRRASPFQASANYAAHDWLKVTLPILKDALALRNEKDYHAYRDINTRLDHAWAVRTKYPWERQTRLEIQMDEHEFSRRKGEMTRGYLDDQTETIPYSIMCKHLKKPLWTDADRIRVNGLIGQMLDRKQGPIQLPRGTDGAPFLWRPEHMPYDWSWAKLEGHMAWHFELLDKWCDWRNDTAETPETLFLELVWQWIDNGGRDPLRRLPMTLFAHHATAWAIGHLHHGLPMLTRWPTGVVITDIAQRDDSRCNVVIEPRIINYLKMDYAEEEYELILNDHLQNCKDETEWFERPPATLSALKLTESGEKRLKRAAQFTQRELDNDDESGEGSEWVDPVDIDDDIGDDLEIVQ